jgi:hypothetical protein
VGISEKQTAGKDTGSLSLCFYVERKKPLSKLQRSQVLPPVMAAPNGEAVFTDVQVIGTLAPEVNAKRTPLQSGFSIGHVKVTAGTLGAIVKRGSKYFVLSNAHVLAQSGLASPGDAIIYPGKADHGRTADLVGLLTEFVPFTKGGDFVNRVDAAIAEIDPSRLEELNFAIYGSKLPLTTVKPVRGMTVMKRGRTTGDTQAKIRDVNFRFVLNYKGKVGNIGFLDQVLCERYTDGGDSGSIVVDKKSGAIVGLHFAGADGGSVFNPIDAVIKALKVRFVSS